MVVRDYPFTATGPGDTPKPYLVVTIVNPSAGVRQRVLALIDTGADECALPASFANVLKHDLQAGKPTKVSTGNGETTAYKHTIRIEIEDFATEDVHIDFLPNLTTPLLGVKSFLSNFKLTIDYPNNVFSLS